MKFAKGVMIGGLISAGVMLMYSETMNKESKKMIKKGKKFIKQIGFQKQNRIIKYSPVLCS